MIALNSNFSIFSRDIVHLLKDTARVVGVLVTIGWHLEEKRDIYVRDKETARAFLLDAFGSAAVEGLANLVQKNFNRELEKANLITTRRFSPGYGDWALSEQPAFLNWLKAERLGISLSAGMVMKPEKSVSALCGIIKKYDENQ